MLFTCSTLLAAILYEPEVTNLRVTNYISYRCWEYVYLLCVREIMSTCICIYKYIAGIIVVGVLSGLALVDD